MRVLSYPKFPLAIWANHFGGMSAIPLVSRYNNHKIFNPIVLFVLNGTKEIFYSFVMNQFPLVETTSKMFRHYKTVFWNVTSFISHRKEKIIRGDPNKNIAFASNSSTTFPSRIGRTWQLFAATSTLLTMQTGWHPILQRCPALFTTSNASYPYQFIKTCSITVAPIREGIFGSSYFAYLWHTYIIPFANTLCKGVELSES